MHAELERKTSSMCMSCLGEWTLGLVYLKYFGSSIKLCTLVTKYIQPTVDIRLPKKPGMKQGGLLLLVGLTWKPRTKNTITAWLSRPFFIQIVRHEATIHPGRIRWTNFIYSQKTLHFAPQCPYCVSLQSHIASWVSNKEIDLHTGPSSAAFRRNNVHSTH